MADSETITSPPSGGDAELLCLHAQHMDALRRYDAEDFGADTPENARFMDGMVDLEDRIAAVPAAMLAGLLVRLWVLWSWLNAEPGVFTGPSERADKEARLVWGVLQDAARLQASAPA